MSDDLVARLRDARYAAFDDCGDYDLAQEAATALEAKDIEIERWAAQTLKEEDCWKMWRARTLAAESELSEARAEIERLREAAKGQNAVVNIVWNTFVDAPEPGRKFVALYNDGSGARMFFTFDGGVIDCDGDELYGFDLAEQSYGLWAYLPDNFEFWCETHAEYTMTLKVIR